jgi:hypothetical protein
MARIKRETFVTPKGTAVYPWLNKPDTKFSPEGEYKVTLKIPTSEAEDLISRLTGIAEDYHEELIKTDPKSKHLRMNFPWEEEMDDQGNVTGNYLFKFKQKANITGKDGSSYSMNVALFDAKRNPSSSLVGGGSEIKVAATVWPYKMNSTKTVGLSLKPTAVQIINLVSVGGGSAASMFNDEDGFVEDIKTPSEVYVDDTAEACDF